MTAAVLADCVLVVGEVNQQHNHHDEDNCRNCYYYLVSHLEIEILNLYEVMPQLHVLLVRLVPHSQPHAL